MFIDLSVLLNENTPVYPGDAPVKISKSGSYDTHGYLDHNVSFNNHNGTHIDAPIHMIPNGKTLDRFGPEKFIGNGVLIDVRDGTDLIKVQNTKIEQGDIVIFWTGMEFGKGEYYTNYPAISEEIAKYLVQHNPKMVGTDTCSFDNKEGFPNHKILLGEEILLIENLTNLNALENKKFKIYALPLKLQLDGSPARVVAQIE